jgi:hypothetical protein
MATKPGTYGHYREEGAVFAITDDRHFSKSWMVKVTDAQAKKLQTLDAAEGKAAKHVVDTTVVDNAELEALRAQLAESNAEVDRLKRGQAGVIADAAKSDTGDGKGNEPAKSAQEVLVLANDSSVAFATFKAEARKVLGDDIAATKAEIVAALEDKATQP